MTVKNKALALGSALMILTNTISAEEQSGIGSTQLGKPNLFSEVLNTAKSSWSLAFQGGLGGTNEGTLGGHKLNSSAKGAVDTVDEEGAVDAGNEEGVVNAGNEEGAVNAKGAVDAGNKDNDPRAFCEVGGVFRFNLHKYVGMEVGVLAVGVRRMNSDNLMERAKSVLGSIPSFGEKIGIRVPVLFTTLVGRYLFINGGVVVTHGCGALELFKQMDYNLIVGVGLRLPEEVRVIGGTRFEIRKSSDWKKGTILSGLSGRLNISLLNALDREIEE